MSNSSRFNLVLPFYYPEPVAAAQTRALLHFSTITLDPVLFPITAEHIPPVKQYYVPTSISPPNRDLSALH